jgi:hypothetical protein
MNLRTTPFLELINAFIELEGLSWVEQSIREEREDRSYTLLGALSWLSRTRHNSGNHVRQLQEQGDSRDWPVIFSELLLYQVYDIYGCGGWNRYYVDAHGEIRFSHYHSIKDDQIKAAKLGFDVR